MKTPDKVLMKLNSSGKEQWFIEHWPTIREGINIVRMITSNIIIRVACKLIIALGDILAETVSKGS